MIRRARSIRGGAAVELALCLPLFLILLAGVANVGGAIGQRELAIKSVHFGARAVLGELSSLADDGAASASSSCGGILSEDLPAELIRRLLYRSCEYAREAGLRPEEWEASALITDGVEIDEAGEFTAHRVELSLRRTDAECSGCLALFRKTRPQGRLAFIY